MLLEFRHPAGRIIEIAKNNRFSGTRLLASSHHFPVADAPVLLFGFDARLGNALNAISALLHHPSPTHRHFRVEHGSEFLPISFGIMIEIETAHLVGAIVGTVA